MTWIFGLSPILWLEWMNAFLFFISLGINLTFGIVIWNGRAYWRDDSERGAVLRGAIAIEVYHLGETSRQGWYWTWSHFGERGLHWLGGPRIFALYLFGALVAVGALCMIRVFSERQYGHMLWVVAMLVAIMLSTVVVLLPTDL